MAATKNGKRATTKATTRPMTVCWTVHQEWWADLEVYDPFDDVQVLEMLENHDVSIEDDELRTDEGVLVARVIRRDMSDDSMDYYRTDYM